MQAAAEGGCYRVGMTMRSLPLLLLLPLAATWTPDAATSAAQTPEARPTIVLPLRPFGTQPAVEVRVNGHGPYLFLVDTGASGVARIDSSVVQALGLRIVGETTAVGATGQAAVPIARVAVDSIEVGGRTYRNLTPLSRSYNVPGEYVPDIGGILALNLFADELLTIDFANRELRIEQGALPPADGRTILDYELRGGVAHIPIVIGGLRTTALVDTGTDRAIDLPTSVIRQLALASFPRPVGRAAGVGGEVTIAEAQLAEPLLVGRHRFEQPRVTFSESFEFPILGAQFFHGLAVTIDQRNRRIRIVSAPAPVRRRR